jgi:flagellar biosynthesis protein FliP
MSYHKAVAELMSFSSNSYYVWKKEERPIILFLHKYLSEADIQEFLKTNKLEKLDLIKDVSIEELRAFKEKGKKQYLTEQINKKKQEIFALEQELASI